MIAPRLSNARTPASAIPNACVTSDWRTSTPIGFSGREMALVAKSKSSAIRPACRGNRDRQRCVHVHRYEQSGRRMLQKTPPRRVLRTRTPGGASARRNADEAVARLAWWQKAVFYQIAPLSFQDTNGDGKGDINGIIQRLDHLEWLGIDAVWLCPIYSSPMLDFGYDMVDFCAVDPLFGSLADFDRLLAELHGRGMKLILDFVPN